MSRSGARYGAGISPVYATPEQYGAKGDGVTDDAAAIQAAINAVQNSQNGGYVVLNPASGTYGIKSGLTIGNGSAAAAATTQPVYLISGGAGSFDIWAGGATPAATIIKWIGAAQSVYMLTLQGPLYGWGVEGIVFFANQVAGINGVQLVAANNGIMRRCWFWTCRTSLSLTSIGAGWSGAQGPGNSMHNRFEQITMTFGQNAGGTNVGVQLTTAAATQNASFNVFDDLTMVFLATANVQTGISFAYSDSNRFRHTHVAGFNGAPGGSTIVLFQYGGLGGNPTGNIFDFIDFGTASANAVTKTGAPAGNAPCAFYNISTVNSAPANPNIGNVIWGDTLDWTPGRLLTQLDYFPAGAAFPSITTGGGQVGGTWYDLDAVNLGGLSFTYPASGQVDVVLEANASITGVAAGAQQYYYRVVDTANGNNPSEQQPVLYNGGTAIVSYTRVKVTCRLTGAAHTTGTVKWQHAIAAAIPAGGGAQTGYGGSGFAWGSARMEVKAA